MERSAVAASRLGAIRAGEAALAAGGNAMDAAVAVSLAIGAVEPHMSGLGGALELVHRAPDGTVRAVDGALRAPLAAGEGTFELDPAGDADALYGWPPVRGARNVHGPASVCAPRLVPALAAAHAAWGRLLWADAVAPAVAVAEAGQPVVGALAAVLAEEAASLSRDPLAASLFFPGGHAAAPAIDGPEPVVPNPALAAALRTVAAEGAAPWAPGGAHTRAVLDALGDGGLLTAVDFAAGDAAAPRDAPVLTTFRGWAIHGSPLASGACSAAHVLGILDRLDPPGTAHERHAQVARAAVVAFRARLAELGGDTPSLALLDPAQLDRDAAAARDLRFDPAPAGGTGPVTATTTFAVADADGGVVSATQTLLGLFGSHVGVPALGGFLNDGMLWFDPRPGRPASLRPGARALSAVAPVIAVAPDGRVLAAGAAGARRIVTAVAQIVGAVAGDGLGAGAAVDRPRVHTDSLTPVAVDHRLGDGAVDALRAAGLAAAPAPFTPTTLTSGLGCAVLAGPGGAEAGIDARSAATWRFAC